MTWAICAPVTKAKLASGGRPKSSFSQPPATSSTTEAAGLAAWMPAFWSQAVVSQSAAMAEGRPPPMTQPKKRPDCMAERPREASATSSSTTWAAGVPAPGSGRPSALRSSSRVAVGATGRVSSASR